MMTIHIFGLVMSRHDLVPKKGLQQIKASMIIIKMIRITINYI